MTVLYTLTTEDVDCYLNARAPTDEERAACYDAVRDMDSSMIFEQVEVLIDMTLQEKRL